MDAVKNAISNTIESVSHGVHKITHTPIGPPNYIRYDQEGVEQHDEQEDAKIRETVEIMNRLLEKNFNIHGHAFRGTHIKSQAIVKGTITILDDLPTPFRQGLFATSGTHPLIMRYANEPSDLIDDRITAPRGVGMKIFNVPGKKLISEDSQTQDFSFNNAPVIELTDINVNLEIQKLREKYSDQPEKLKAAVATRRDAARQLAPFQLPNIHLLAHTFYSQAAYRYGDFVCKFSIVPTLQKQKELQNKKVTNDHSPNVLREWASEYFSVNSAEYDFRIQLCTDLYLMPVEDASVEWPESVSPYVTVARINIPPQETFSDERRVFWEEKIKIDPWAGLEEHCPLGSINRLRRQVYETSRQFRQKRNLQVISNLKDINDVPN
ncbi:hypothetical protein AKO1_009612 [Acrasis kona]|uniref:Catalase n=1 Tax=Acrasis kona TaxID=1008807 RepID=A0AAW2ZN24_9EUKA